MVILTSTVTPFLKDGENHSGSYHKIHKLDLFPPEKKKHDRCLDQALIRLVDELADAKVAGRVSLYCRL